MSEDELVIGVDLGGTKCLGLLVDPQGTVVAEHRLPTPTGSSAVLDAVTDVVTALSKTARVRAVGVGMPGLVDNRGVMRFAPNLPGVTQLDVKSEIFQRTGLPVVVENDASCAAWAESSIGSASDVSTFVLVTLGTGIGGGLVIEGELYRGANGFAGEIGHVMVHPNGPPCVCGSRGCWERFASGSGLGRLARDAIEAGNAPGLLAQAGGDVESVRGEHVTDAARQGDEDALKILGDFSWWVAVGLANLANIFDPECFVIGGGLVAAEDLILDRVREHLPHMIEAAAFRPTIDIRRAALGERAGGVGAALLAYVTTR